MFTATADLILPSTVTGSWPRPRWFDVSMWGEPLDTCMMDVRFREKFQDALAVVISDAGARRARHPDARRLPLRRGHGRPRRGTTTRCSAGPASRATTCSPRRRARPGCTIPPGTLLNEIYTGWRWPHVVDKIEHRPLGYPKIWRMAQARRTKPVRFGTCCSQVMALFLDIHTQKYKDKRQVIWDMAEAMNTELLALRDAGCRLIQIEEPTFHFMANTFGKDHEEVLFLIDAFNREVQGLDDVELWIHTCWGNPNMQRVMEDTSYAHSIEIYLERCRGDVWTLEMKDRNQRDIELFAPFSNDLKKKICIGAVSHRTLQADRAEDVAGEIRKRADAHPGRAADRVERLRVRTPGLQPRDRLLQGQRHRAGLQHRPRRARPADDATFRPPIRSCRSTWWSDSDRRDPVARGQSPPDLDAREVSASRWNRPSP